MIALQALFVVVFGALPFYAWLTMNAAVESNPLLRLDSRSARR